MSAITVQATVFINYRVGGVYSETGAMRRRVATIGARKTEYRPTLIRKGATIGASATVLYEPLFSVEVAAGNGKDEHGIH
jgi:hypothetical protein